jgi:hypothetical protein
MTVWDFLTNYLPPIALTATGITAVVVILIGFARYGMDFIKHGFKHTGLDNSLEKRFDDLGTRIDGLHSELASIKENHFGHLKNYLTALNGTKQRKLGMAWAAVQLRQICADYSISIPPGDLSLEEIRFFYNPMIDSLCKIQKELEKGKRGR